MSHRLWFSRLTWQRFFNEVDRLSSSATAARNWEPLVIEFVNGTTRGKNLSTGWQKVLKEKHKLNNWRRSFQNEPFFLFTSMEQILTKDTDRNFSFQRTTLDADFIRTGRRALGSWNFPKHPKTIGASDDMWKDYLFCVLLSFVGWKRWSAFWKKRKKKILTSARLGFRLREDHHSKNLKLTCPRINGK